MTDLPLVYIYSMLAMQKKAFNRISPEDQVIVRSVMDSMFRQVEVDTRIDNEKAFEALRTIGIEIVAADQLAQWQAVADQSVERLIQSGEISPESVRLYLANLRKYRHSQDGSD